MQITALREDDAALQQQIQEGWDRRRDSEVPRAPGFHTSAIIQDMIVTSGLAKAYSDELDLMSMLRMTMGFIWEDIVGDYLADFFHMVTQVVVEKDGIWSTIDVVDQKDFIIWEYKATWRGEEKAIQNGQRWFWQIMTYCYVVGFTEAKLRVLHMCPVPRMRTYKLNFTQQELEENWFMITQHRDYMAGQGRVR